MRTYGLIGFPLGHSFSRQFFTEKFIREEIPEQYLNFEIENINCLPSVIREYPDLAGLNVTIPYKEQIIPFLGHINQEAKEVGAVNTVRIKREKEDICLEGFNTDVFGFMVSLFPLLKPVHTAALIFGTGGASKAVRFVLDKLAIEWVQVSRNSGGKNIVTYDQLTPSIVHSHLLIINTTPLGTFPYVETAPELPYTALTPDHLMYDLVYNPEETRFLASGREQGAITKNGREMLELQALKSYEIWNEP